MKTLNEIDLGVLPYEDTYFLQKKILQDIKINRSDDSILVVEHPDIFTIGRSGSKKNILVDKEYIRESGIKIIDVDRGGDITFHGMGQLVAYPIFDLRRHTKDIRIFLKNLERSLELTISEYGLTADKEEQYTGIWVGGNKVGFIGIGVSNWITYHGISINVNVDLKYFSMIRPCGIDGLRVSSLQNILKRTIDLGSLKEIFLKKCCEVFGFEHLHRCSKNAFMAEEEAAQ